MPSFGEEFRRERELREISLREVSDSTKISMRYLEALEGNNFTHLPGGVFNRGFVRTVAQYIGVDPEAMVNAYLVEEQAQTSAEQAAEDQRFLRSRTAFEPLEALLEKEKAAGPGSFLMRQWKPALFATLGLILLGAAILVGIGRWGDGETDVAALGPEPARPAPAGPTARPAGVDPGDDGETPGSADSGASPPVEPRREPPPVETRPDPVETPVVEPEQTRPAEEAPAIATTSPAPTRRPTPQQDDAIRATFIIARATGGRINCDNRQIEVLSGVRPGTRIDLRCERFVIVDADDGGALQLGLAGRPPVVLGSDGEPIRGYRIYRSHQAPDGDGP